VGKTRLALQAAASLAKAYRDGVLWVELASSRDRDDVAWRLSQAVGAKDGLVSWIKERELLFVLDNFEQVISAAPDVSELLSSCPNVSFLVTSRELLRVHGEIEHPVPPLSNDEAIELFCQRAQTAPNEVIGQLCARVDNLPLGIELAAARIKALSPQQILERLVATFRSAQGWTGFQSAPAIARGDGRVELSNV
jgi:predicted ATPase